MRPVAPEFQLSLNRIDLRLESDDLLFVAISMRTSVMSSLVATCFTTARATLRHRR